MPLSLLIVLAMGLGLALFVWKVSTAWPVVHRVVTRWFWCRFRTQNVNAEFQEDPWSGRRVGISLCTAFTPPSAITCDRECLLLWRLDPALDLDADAERVAEGMLMSPPRSTADANRVAEELLDRAPALVDRSRVALASAVAGDPLVRCPVLGVGAGVLISRAGGV